MEQTNTVQVIEWPRWLNQRQAAKYAGCAVNTFKTHLVATGKVKTHLLDFGPRYDREEINKAIQEVFKGDVMELWNIMTTRITVTLIGVGGIELGYYLGRTDRK